MVVNIKTVGIIIREFTENNINFIGTRNDLFKSLSRFNISVIGIPINTSYDKLIDIINICDGIILSGGSIFHKNDFKLIKYLIEKDIPTLGICLGMQTIGEYFNNKQEIEVSNHYHNNHKVKINKESKLYEILNKEEIIVNSRHHTAIPNTNLLISAQSEDQIIEGIEIPELKFFIGLQWHPESTDDVNNYQLFQYFINIL